MDWTGRLLIGSAVIAVAAVVGLVSPWRSEGGDSLPFGSRRAVVRAASWGVMGLLVAVGLLYPAMR